MAKRHTMGLTKYKIMAFYGLASLANLANLASIKWSKTENVETCQTCRHLPSSLVNTCQTRQLFWQILAKLNHVCRTPF